MSDPIPTPGVRVGQVWQRIKAKGGHHGRIEVELVGPNAVVCRPVSAAGERGRTASHVDRTLFEQRYRLVSEGQDRDA